MAGLVGVVLAGAVGPAGVARINKLIGGGRMPGIAGILVKVGVPAKAGLVGRAGTIGMVGIHGIECWHGWND